MVHYGVVDDNRAIGHLAHVEALRRFVTAVVMLADPG